MQGFLMGKGPEDRGSTRSPLSARHNAAPFWLPHKSPVILVDTWRRILPSCPPGLPETEIPTYHTCVLLGNKNCSRVR